MLPEGYLRLLTRLTRARARPGRAPLRPRSCLLGAAPPCVRQVPPPLPAPGPPRLCSLCRVLEDPPGGRGAGITTAVSFTLGDPSEGGRRGRGGVTGCHRSLGWQWWGGGGQAGPGRVAERCRPGWESPPPLATGWALPTFGSLCPGSAGIRAQRVGSAPLGARRARSHPGVAPRDAASTLPCAKYRHVVVFTSVQGIRRTGVSSQLQAMFNPPRCVTLPQRCGETRSGSEPPRSGLHTLRGPIPELPSSPNFPGVKRSERVWPWECFRKSGHSCRPENCGDLSLRLAKEPAKDGLGGRRRPRKSPPFSEGCVLLQCLLPVPQMSPESNFSALRLIFFARGLSLALIVPIN